MKTRTFSHGKCSSPVDWQLSCWKAAPLRCIFSQFGAQFGPPAFSSEPYGRSPDSLSAALSPSAVLAISWFLPSSPAHGDPTQSHDIDKHDCNSFLSRATALMRPTIRIERGGPRSFTHFSKLGSDARNSYELLIESLSKRHRRAPDFSLVLLWKTFLTTLICLRETLASTCIHNSNIIQVTIWLISRLSHN